MQIVLAGGWGYGNLGDDAILSSTIKLLNGRFPQARISVLTYECDRHLSRTYTDVDFVQCLHWYVDRKSSYSFYRPIDKKINFPKIVSGKAWHFCLENISLIRHWMVSRGVSNFSSIIREADLFVVGGGGYLNSDWKGNVASSLAQIELANSFGVPVYFCGPGFGHFGDDSIRSRIFQCVKTARKVWVRDIFTANDIRSAREDFSVIPDIALTDYRPAAEKGGRKSIGVIVNKINKDLFDSLAIAIGTVVGKGGSVKLLLSRRWKGDLASAIAFGARLDIEGVRSTVVVPSDHESLETEIRQCQILISENLHGLILAVRNGVPVVAINDYASDSPNGRKFLAFMSQLESESFVVNSSMSTSDVSWRIEASFQGFLDGSFENRYIDFCSGVRDMSLEFFDVSIEIERES